MQDFDFKDVFNKAKTALQGLDAKIANMEEELTKARNEHRAAVLVYNAVAPLVEQPLLPTESDAILPVPGLELIKTSGISVAIRSILDSCTTEDFTAAQMRDRLAQNGWDWKEYTNPVATVLTTLKRLCDSGKAKETKADGNKAFYSANRVQTIANAGLKINIAELMKVVAPAAPLGTFPGLSALPQSLIEALEAPKTVVNPYPFSKKKK